MRVNLLILLCYSLIPKQGTVGLKVIPLISGAFILERVDYAQIQIDSISNFIRDTIQLHTCTNQISQGPLPEVEPVRTCPR
jgi:hypothetical protein